MAQKEVGRIALLRLTILGIFIWLGCLVDWTIGTHRARTFELLLTGMELVGTKSTKEGLSWPRCVLFCGDCPAIGWDPETKLCTKYNHFCLGCYDKLVVSPTHQFFGATYDYFLINGDLPPQNITWPQARAACQRQGGDLAYFPRFNNYMYMYMQILGPGYNSFFVGLYLESPDVWIKMYDDSEQDINWVAGQTGDVGVYGYYRSGFFYGVEEGEGKAAHGLCRKVSKIEY